MLEEARAQKLSVREALERLAQRCATDEGCLVVEVEWKAPRYLNDSALEMRLQIINANESFD